MTRTQKTVFILVALIALVLGLTINKVLSGKGQGDPTALIDAGIILLPQSRNLPAVTMTDQDGKPVAINELKDKWSLLFFGYTFCPDICPTTLAQLRQQRQTAQAHEQAAEAFRAQGYRVVDEQPALAPDGSAPRR